MDSQHLHPLVWTDHLTGDSKLIWQTFQSTMNTKHEGIDNTDAIKGTYLDNYRQIWDLYINNATCKPTELSTKTADDATADFVTGDAVFYQNGTWEYNNIAKTSEMTILECFQSTSV